MPPDMSGLSGLFLITMAQRILNCVPILLWDSPSHHIAGLRSTSGPTFLAHFGAVFLKAYPQYYESLHGRVKRIDGGRAPCSKYLIKSVVTLFFFYSFAVIDSVA
jgi:hypothetical protein